MKQTVQGKRADHKAATTAQTVKGLHRLIFAADTVATTSDVIRVTRMIGFDPISRFNLLLSPL